MKKKVQIVEYITISKEKILYKNLIILNFHIK